MANPQISGTEGGLSALGFAGSIYGTMQTTSGAKAKAQSEQQIARLEIQADAVRRQAMELSARRQQLQTVRNAQQARAMALSAATNQGAQFSSGLQGGYGSISGQASTSQVGVSQNLQFGEQIFGINQQIDAQKILEASAETKMAEGQGISSIFGSLGKSAQGIGQLASLFPAIAL